MLCILAFDKPKPNYIKFLQGLIVSKDFYKGIIKMRTIINTNGLVENGLINIDEKKQIEEVAEFFSIGISKTMQGQILNNNNNDPIFAQFVPSAVENIVNEYEIYDPIGDDEHLKLNGLVHRYNNRALVKLNKVCPVYCRFCFRREKIGRAKANGLNFDELNQILEYLEKNSQINEVILSGGDPLIYNKKSLSYLCEGLNKLPNIEILRIHSRVPIVSPDLVNSALLNSINKFQKAKFLIIHINHIQELSEISIEILKKIQKSDILILSQTVLLKGINDKPEVLAKLFSKLLSLQIKPYYLHHPDLARGTSHFGLNLEQGMKIYNDLKSLISGLGLPRYVLDIPKGFGKIDLNLDNVKIDENQNYKVRDKNGNWHFYPNIILKPQNRE